MSPPSLRYLAALATIATRPALLESIAPSNQSFESGSYAGIFQFNFWRFGEWKNVIIDDRLPYYNVYGKRNDTLLFCHNKDEDNEFWSALCEKAYAKCFGSYKVGFYVGGEGGVRFSAWEMNMD